MTLRQKRVEVDEYDDDDTSVVEVVSTVAGRGADGVDGDTDAVTRGATGTPEFNGDDDSRGGGSGRCRCFGDKSISTGEP